MLNPTKNKYSTTTSDVKEFFDSYYIHDIPKNLYIQIPKKTQSTKQLSEIEEYSVNRLNIDFIIKSSGKDIKLNTMNTQLKIDTSDTSLDTVYFYNAHTLALDKKTFQKQHKFQTIEYDYYYNSKILIDKDPRLFIEDPVIKDVYIYS